MFEEILEKLPEFLNTFENCFYNIEKNNTEKWHTHILVYYSGKARFDNQPARRVATRPVFRSLPSSITLCQ
jgi:hypothetical protein